MKKREAVNHIISVVGFVPHPVIFEIYSDEDEIPQGLVDVECNYPASDMDFNLSLGWESYDYFMKMIQDFPKKN